MLRVHIANRQQVVPIDRGFVRQLVRAAAPGEWGQAAVSVAIVDDAQIARLNQEFLGAPGPTDVLAFPLGDDDTTDSPTIGEVVVSAERAAAEAASRRLRPEEELALYVVHGVLHLAGHDDHDAKGRRAMRARESEVLARFGMRRDAPGRSKVS